MWWRKVCDERGVCVCQNNLHRNSSMVCDIPLASGTSATARPEVYQVATGNVGARPPPLVRRHIINPSYKVEHLGRQVLHKRARIDKEHSRSDSSIGTCVAVRSVVDIGDNTFIRTEGGISVPKPSTANKGTSGAARRAPPPKFSRPYPLYRQGRQRS